METIEAFGEELEGEVTSSAQHHILYVNKDDVLLEENKKDFYRVKAKLLHLVKQGRPDL